MSTLQYRPPIYGVQWLTPITTACDNSPQSQLQSISFIRRPTLGDHQLDYGLHLWLCLHLTFWAYSGTIRAHGRIIGAIQNLSDSGLFFVSSLPLLVKNGDFGRFSCFLWHTNVNYYACDSYNVCTLTSHSAICRPQPLHMQSKLALNLQL